MSEYTPDTEEVRQRYVDARYQYSQGRLQRTLDEFDRWLSELIRKEREEAWDEGSEDGVWNSEHEGMIQRGIRERVENPYRKE